MIRLRNPNRIGQDTHKHEQMDTCQKHGIDRDVSIRQKDALGVRVAEEINGPAIHFTYVSWPLKRYTLLSQRHVCQP